MNWHRELSVSAEVPLRLHPIVARELSGWKDLASRMPDKALREQALSSLRHKRFHCVGGSVLALLSPLRVEDMVRAIVAVQTISDYLDNLCDRAGAAPDREAFMLLHEALMCAVEPGRGIQDFYALYPLSLGERRNQREAPDAGYLNSLVGVSRSVIKTLPGYDAVRERVARLCRLYCEMQSTKHLEPGYRDDEMAKWFGTKKQDRFWGERCAGLPWWEFAAAAGSTLGMFCLIASASSPDLKGDTARLLDEAYFPSIAGLHILLDYLVDLEEDRQGGDLNFVAHYPSVDDAVDRIQGYVLRAKEAASRLDALAWGRQGIHPALVKGLLAMYLSDPKVTRQGLTDAAKKMTTAAGTPTTFLRAACGLARRALRF